MFTKVLFFIREKEVAHEGEFIEHFYTKMSDIKETLYPQSY